MTPKQKRTAGWILKISVFLASLLYLVIKLVKSSHNAGFWDHLLGLGGYSIVLILIAIIMVFLNWGLESYKWKLLILKLEPISLMKSWKAVWAGLTVSNLIPNRLGEFMVRILFLKRENRIKAIFSTLIGGYCQFFITALMGSIGLIWWFSYMPAFHIIILTLSLIGINFMLFFGFYHMSHLPDAVSGIKMIRRLKNYFDVLNQYSQREITYVLVLSVVRYFVYAVQYFLLFRAFGVEVTLWQGFMVASLIFIAQAIIPSVTLTEIGIRGATVLYFGNRISANVAGMLMAAYVLWLVNVIIPSFIGAYFVLGIRKR